jgi:hypothetical protein
VEELDEEGGDFEGVWLAILHPDRKALAGVSYVIPAVNPHHDDPSHTGVVDSEFYSHR